MSFRPIRALFCNVSRRNTPSAPGARGFPSDRSPICRTGLSASQRKQQQQQKNLNLSLRIRILTKHHYRTNTTRKPERHCSTKRSCSSAGPLTAGDEKAGGEQEENFTGRPFAAREQKNIHGTRIGCQRVTNPNLKRANSPSCDADARRVSVCVCVF